MTCAYCGLDIEQVLKKWNAFLLLLVLIIVSFIYLEKAIIWIIDISKDIE